MPCSALDPQATIRRIDPVLYDTTDRAPLKTFKRSPGAFPGLGQTFVSPVSYCVNGIRWWLFPGPSQTVTSPVTYRVSTDCRRIYPGTSRTSGQTSLRLVIRRLPGQDPCDPLHGLLQVFHAGGEGQTHVARRAKGRSRYQGHAGVTQQEFGEGDIVRQFPG